MTTLRITITNGNRAQVARELVELLRTAPAGHVVEVIEPDKSRIQEKKYHALIGDIARCCMFKGFKWTADSWKRLLVEAFVNIERDAARAAGEPDPFPDHAFLVEGLDGRSIVQLGEQTRTFSRRQSCDFIESLYAYGCERGVIWSEPAKKVIRAIGKK